MRTRPLPTLLRSFLLRVRVEGGRRVLDVQDLRSGERREFATERELRRFLAEHRPMRLR